MSTYSDLHLRSSTTNNIFDVLLLDVLNNRFRHSDLHSGLFVCDDIPDSLIQLDRLELGPKTLGFGEEAFQDLVFALQLHLRSVVIIESGDALRVPIFFVLCFDSPLADLPGQDLDIGCLFPRDTIKFRFTLTQVRFLQCENTDC